MACFTLLVVLSTSFKINLAHSFTDEELTTAQRNIAPRLISAATSQRSTVIVYDDTYEHSALTISTMVGQDKYMAMYKYPEFPNFLDQQMKWLLEHANLKEFRDELNFILICEKECTDIVITQARNLDNAIGQRSLLRHFSTWLIITCDPPPNLNITFDNMALMIIQLNKTSVTWKDDRTVGMYSDKIHLIDVHTLLWTHKGREWSRVSPCDLSDDKMYVTLFPNSLRGLNGRQLIIATLEWLPFTKRQHIPGKISYVGASLNIIDYLADKFNFSYVFVEPADKLWGHEIDNQNWTGILGMIQRREADICSIPYGTSIGRKKVMDFSTPFTATVYSALYRRQRYNAHSWFYLLSCFSWQVYLCGSSSFLLIMLLLAYVQKRKVLNTSEKVQGFSSCFEAGIRITLRQAITKIPEQISARILVFSLSLLCLVMTAVYTGNLVAVMSVDKHNVPFTTIQELAEQDEYEVGVTDGTIARDILKSSNDPIYRAVYDKVRKSREKEVLDPGEEVVTYLRRFMNNNYVLIASEETKHYMKSKTCEIVAMKERFLVVHAGFPYPFNSPMKKLFDNQLSILRENGVIEQWISNWTVSPLKCDGSGDLPQLEFGNLKTVVVTCACSIILATIVLLFEKWTKKCSLILL